MKINKLLESKKLKESYIVDIVYDSGKHKAQADDGIHGKSWVDFPKHMINYSGQQYEVDKLLWNGTNYTVDGSIKYLNKPKDDPRVDAWIAHRQLYKEGLSHFEFTSGSNPYIAKTKDEAERIKRSRGDSVRYVGSINGIDYYKVDDGEEKDLFRVAESKQLNETEYGKDVTYPSIKTSRIPRNATKLKGIGRHNGESNTFVKTKSGWTYDHNGVYVNPDTIRYGYTDVEVLETDPNYKPNRTKPEYVVQGNYGYGWEDLTASDNQAEARNDLKAYRENETGVLHRLITRRVPVTENLKEAFRGYCYYPLTRLPNGRNICGPEYDSLKDAFTHAILNGYEEVAKEDTNLFNTNPIDDIYSVKELEGKFPIDIIYFKKYLVGDEESSARQEYPDYTFADTDTMTVCYKFLNEATNINEAKKLYESTGNFSYENRCVYVSDEDFEIGNVPETEGNDIGSQSYPSYALADYNDGLQCHRIVLTSGYYEGACIDFIEIDNYDALEEYRYVCENECDQLWYNEETDMWTLNGGWGKEDMDLPIEEAVKFIQKCLVDYPMITADDIRKALQEEKDDGYYRISVFLQDGNLEEKIVNQIANSEIDKCNQIIDQIKADYGYRELTTTARFSNGETMYDFIESKKNKWKTKSIKEGYEFNPNRADISWRPYDNEKGQVMADRWYERQYPDDKIGIEQLRGITLDAALKDRSILGHCDTQVRERVYAQLDKYIPLSVDSPMYKEKNESKSIKEDSDSWILVKNNDWYDPEGLNIKPPQRIICQGTKEECKAKFDKIVNDAKNTVEKEKNKRYGKSTIINKISDTYIEIYYPMAVANVIYQLMPDIRTESLSESNSTHCVYFTQDGVEQIEFEGTEDECNKYISDSQAEQDAEFGDEAPERFVKRLTEGYFSDDDVEDDIAHANLYGGDTMYCRDCGTKKKWDDGYSYCPKCNDELEEAHYGGAFDIADDQYFTRDDLLYFADEVLGNVTETFKGTFDIGGVWFEDGCVVTQIVDDEGNMFEDTTRVDMRKMKEPWHLRKAYSQQVSANIIKQIKELKRINESSLSVDDLRAYYSTATGIDKEKYPNFFVWYDEMVKSGKFKLGEDLEVGYEDESIMQGPQEGPEFGIASLITSAIQSTWSNVQMYNELSVAARMEGFNEIANIIDEINTNESKHIGHLQSALKIVSPNAEAIELGNEEGSEILSNPIK